jgi:hypothetical protein
MTSERDTLGKIQAISNIAAAVLIPILVAYFGWNSEKYITESRNSSEFVKMALNILADDSKTVAPDLKAWAIQVIDKESPIPLSYELSGAIADGSVQIAPYILTPKEILEPPLPLPEFTGKTNGDLIEYILELQSAYQLNSINHEALLKWLEQIEGGDK